MSDTPRTDAASVSREYIEREMDRYTQKFVLADHMSDLERELAEAVAKERERCAKVCDEITNSMYWLNDRSEISQDCAAAIRKGEIKDGNAD